MSGTPSRTDAGARQVRAAGRAAGFAVGLLVALFLASPLAWPGPAAAAGPDPSQPDPQDVVVLGTVVDAESGDGVSAAWVRILRPEEDGPARVVQELETNEDGGFATEPLPVGTYGLRIEVVGYETLQGEFRVEGRSPMLLGVQLVPEAVELEPVVVSSVRSSWLENVGYYERAQRDQGVYFDRTDIELRNPLRATDLVRRAGGVTLRELGGVSAPVVTMRQGCLADLVVDGQNLGRGESPDSYVSPGDIEAMEVHRGLTAPQQYTQSTCGAVLIWTRDPGELAGREFELGRTLRILGIFGAALWLLAR